MESIEQLIKELPEGYEKVCYREKAIQRKRGISEPKALMKLAMFHLLNGCSLTEISTIAHITGLGEISDVAFMKRFEKCNNWFTSIISELTKGGMITYRKPEYVEKYRIIAVDASDVTEKGRSGRRYRLHFALDLFNMESLQYKITDHEIGESLSNFKISKGELWVADRGYSGLKGITHCMACGGEYVIRLRKNGCKLYDSNGKLIQLTDCLNTLDDKEYLDLQGYAMRSKGEKIPIRVCAKRKSDEDIAQTQKKLRRKESKRQLKMTDDTKRFNQYIVVTTSLSDAITAEQVLEIYRFRWQVELYFKRLKSIMDFGELPKRRQESVFAWLNGKLMIALLIEKIISKADFPPSVQLSAEHMA